MNLIARLRDNVATIKQNIESGILTEDIIRENAAEICRLNHEEQLWEGINAAGVSMWSYQPYAPSTIKYKKRKGQPYDRVTLKDTGAFYSNFYVENNTGGFTIRSTVPYEKYLRKKYGENIYGLTAENYRKLIVSGLKQKIVKKIKNLFK